MYTKTQFYHNELQSRGIHKAVFDEANQLILSEVILAYLDFQLH